jgi:DNA polymerase-3 subunit delta'
MIAADRLPQALLLTGSAGIGKGHFLKAAAAKIMCADPSSGIACGGCRSCQLLAAGSHGDCLVVGAEEGSRVIKIDQVRELIEFAAKTPSLGDRKIILLGPAEAMNLNAANALLKCLEEPSRSTYILLYSHQPSAVPATVRSRCQRVAMAMPEQDQAIDWLTRVTGSQTTAEALLQVCDQRPLDARELYYRDGLDQHLKIREGLQALADGRLSPLDFPALVSELELDRVLALLQGYLEETIRERLSAGDSGTQDMFQLRDELARQKNAVTRGANPNRQLIIEDCATRLISALGALRS